MQRFWFGVLAAAATVMLVESKEATMQDLAPEIREYLSSPESITRKMLIQRHPDLPQRLADPATRRSVLNWLAGEEPWDPDAAGLAETCLAFVGKGARPDEAPTIRPFLLHPEASIRQRAYEFLLLLYFPDHNPAALLAIYQDMLLDSADAIRSAALVQFGNTTLRDEFRPFLQRWVLIARARDWTQSESYALAQRQLETK